MILDFTIENFRSYKEKTTISFVAEEDEYNEESVAKVTLSDDMTKLRILKFAGIFGPNASGKSNVIYALEALQKFIRDSFQYSFMESIDAYDPFLLDPESAKKPITFQLRFLLKRTVYIYHVKFDRRKVFEECLYKEIGTEKEELYSTYLSGAKRFAKVSDKLSKLKSVLGHNVGGNEFPLNKNQLFMSWIGMFSYNELYPIFFYFMTMVSFTIHSNINLDVNNMQALFLQKSNKMLERLTKLIKIADIGVENIDVKRFKKEAFRFPNGISESAKQEFINKNRIGVQFWHTYTEGSRWSKKRLDISKESVGSKHLLNVGLKVLLALEKGSVLAMDEMNLAIHPALFKFLVAMFNNPKANKNKAQLIFTTHDASIAGEGFMRADQVWFAQKKQDGSSDLFSASEFEGVSINTPFEMWYRTGRFGALPNLSCIDEIFDDD